MSSPGVTEFAYVSLKDDAAHDALNPDSVPGKAVEYMINQVLKHPGARNAHWGLSVENPKQLRIFVDWDKVQDHLDYRETEYAYQTQPPLSLAHSGGSLLHWMHI